MSRTFARQAVIEASTKRAEITNGKRGKPQTYLERLTCTPLDPVEPELTQRLGLNSPMELLQTFVDCNKDVVDGDVLVVDEREYAVRAVADWRWRKTTFRNLVIEELKKK